MFDEALKALKWRVRIMEISRGYMGDIQIQSDNKTDVSIMGGNLLKSMLKRMWREKRKVDEPKKLVKG